MSHISFRFIFQNAPGLPFTKWYTKFDESLKEKNCKIFMFCDRSIANGCFINSILRHKSFINIFYSHNVMDELSFIETFIKRNCEAMLLKGMFSECKLDFGSDTHKDLVLRDYEKIKLLEMFNESWSFYSSNKANLFYKISEHYSNLPFSYIWSLFFTENDMEALVVDDFVKNNAHIFGKHMNLNYQMENDKKYKIVYFDTKGQKVNIKPIMDKVEKNGLLLLKNLDVESPSMVGWRDLKNRMIGIIRV
jgi:hypothetical protein